MNKDLLDDRFGRFREIPLGLSQMGHKVIGLCLSYRRRNTGWIKDELVLWKSINASLLKLPGVIQFIFAALKFARKSDVIWACSDSFYGIIGCLLGRICKKPVVFDIYDNFGEFYIASLPLLKQLYHWAIRRSDAITCLSEPFARFIREKFGRSEMVYPIEFAVRDDLFRPLNKNHCRQMLGLPLDALLIGTAGGLFINRDVHILIDAFRQLKDKYPDMQLALAGPLDHNLPIPNNNRFHYLGILHFDRVPYFMNSLDIAVVCYADNEFGKYCFPQKTREFMACDVPVIAAHVGGLKELFQDQPEWLYEPGNTGSLTKALEHRFSNRQTDYARPPSWFELA
ncbi:MAG: glycosyltransferase, partial [Desulfobacteraceae bacterium]|nr:glycosyltransferase [Desulfobacteraceae bacterium]